MRAAAPRVKTAAVPKASAPRWPGWLMQCVCWCVWAALQTRCHKRSQADQPACCIQCVCNSGLAAIGLLCCMLLCAAHSVLCCPCLCRLPTTRARFTSAAPSWNMHGR